MIGFTFNDQHSTDYGMTMRSVDRTALPPLRRRELEVPGRHGRYDFEGNTYDNRTITITCHIKADTFPGLRQKMRLVAGWLKNKGRLMFDDEQDKFYISRLYSQVPLEQQSRNGIVDLVFECEPFAYSSINTTEVTRTNEDPIFIYNNGSVETPAEYTIINDGATSVTNIRIKLIQTR